MDTQPPLTNPETNDTPASETNKISVADEVSLPSPESNEESVGDIIDVIAEADDDYDFVEPDEEYYAIDTKKRGLRSVFTKENFKKYRYLTFSFLVPALTMWLIYIAMGVFPFGDESVLVLDLNGQYVYYFEQLREIVCGEGSFLYCFGRALGGEFMGIYAYYLASPFSYIVCLFPKKMITEALLCMFLLKTGLCGLNFGIYLQYKTAKEKLNKIAVVMFSTMYALTAYAVVQQHNTMWIDNLIFLPFIVMGIERMIKYRRFRMFVISLTVAVMSNFYIGYMTCIFVFFYFFVCYFTIAPEDRNPTGEEAHFGKSFLRIAGCSAMVIAMSAVILWSAYYALTFGKTTFSTPDFTFKSKFDLLDLISKLFIGSYDTVRPEGLPFVYCGSLTLILLPIYFIIKKIPFREKVSAIIVAIFFVFSFTGSTIDLVWHGFQRPNWLNYRYSFILCFFMVYFAYCAFIHIKEVDAKVLLADIAAWIFLLILLQKFDEYEWIDDYGTVWLSFAFFVAYLILMRFQIRSIEKYGVTLAITSVVVLECFVGGLLNLVALDNDVVYSSRVSYRTFIDRVQPVVDEVQAQDDSFYRMEKTFHRKTNDPLALGFRGFSNSTSTLNKNTITFLRQLGLSSKSHWSKYLGGTPVFDMLMGVKYVLAEESDYVSYIYEKIHEYDPGEKYEVISAYKNPYALSIAYGVDNDILSYSMEDQTSPFDRMNDIVTIMTGSEETREVFVPIDLTETTYTGVTLTFATGHRVYTADSSDRKGKVEYLFTAVEDGEIYCYFPSNWARECDLYVNGSKLSTYFGNETCRIVDLGYFTAGEEVIVSLRLTDNDKLYVGTLPTYFYNIDSEELASVYETLSESEFIIEEYTEDSFYGTVDVSVGDELIYTTIPYDEGWKITVDGEEVKLIETLGATISFYAEPGMHSVSIEYRPDCIIYGRLISLAGFIVFAGVCTIDAVVRKRRGY